MTALAGITWEHARGYDSVVAASRAYRGAVRGSLLGGAGVVVSAGTDHPEAARRFASFLAGPQVQRGVYFDGGGSRRTSPPGRTRHWTPRPSGFFFGTRKTLDGAYLRPRHLRYVEFQDLVSSWVTAVLRGESSDTRLIAGLNDAAERLLTSD